MIVITENAALLDIHVVKVKEIVTKILNVSVVITVGAPIVLKAGQAIFYPLLTVAPLVPLDLLTSLVRVRI